MYRPEGWNEVAFNKLYGKGQIRSDEDEAMFEAGADAMLEGLKAECRTVTDEIVDRLRNWGDYGIVSVKDFKGYLVFIPEKRDG